MVTKLATLTPWLSHLGSYAWTVQDILSQAKEHWWTEESLVVNTKTAAQDSIHKAIVSFTERHPNMCGKMGWTFRTCFEKNCLTMLNTERHKWLSYFFDIVKFGKKYCESCDSWSNENILVKFSQIVEKLLPLSILKFWLTRKPCCRKETARCRDVNSNLGPILPRFRDIAGFLLRTTPPVFHPNFRGVPFGLDYWCCGSEERRP